MTIGGALIFTISASSPARNVYGYSILLALGSGLTFQAGYTIATVKVSQKGWPAKDVQSAISLQNISQIGSTLICLLISGQIFQSLAFRNLKSVLTGQDFTDAEIRSAVSGTQSVLFEHLTPEMVEKVTEALTKAISRVYSLSIVAGGISLIVALFMKKERLFGVAATNGAAVSETEVESIKGESI